MGRIGPLELLIILAVLGMGVLMVVAIVVGVVLRRPRRRGPGHRPGVVLPQERVVERQVLVQRCRFCQKLTPVDLSACAECGAKL